MGAWNLPERHTIGDFVGAVLGIDNERDAKEFFDGCVAHIQRQIDRQEWESLFAATEAARLNIGWCFGEGMSGERIAMWSRVCGASHPIFGRAAPTPEEAFQAGKSLAAR